MEALVKKEEGKLPQEVSLISLIQSRYSEIKQIINEFKTTSPKLASQKLPIHMRRRAASHNIKRLPSRTRTKISKSTRGKEGISEVKEKKRKQKKKYRNRSKIELSHAVREAKSDRSLLHIWFVKRFKMIKQFNQLIPVNNTTKNQRKLHRMSKIGCTHFYFPQFQSIIIRIKNVDLIATFLDKLSKNDFKSFFSDSFGCNSTWAQFYHPSKLDETIMGPGYMVFDRKHSLLVIWCHTLIHEKILNYLVENTKDHSDEVLDGKKVYQLFSLNGSESLHHLKKILDNCGSFLPDNFEDGSVFPFSNWSFLSNQAIKTEKTKRIETIDDYCDFGYIHMSSLNNRNLMLLTVPYSKVKDFWYKLVKNRTHLVGGSRDFKLIASEMRCLHYPSIGYPDLPKELNSHHETWTQIIDNLSENSEYFLLRDEKVIEKLKFPSLCPTLVKDLIQSQPKLTNSLVYVEINCINRGTPNEGDIICLPLEEDIKTFYGRPRIDTKLDETGYGPIEPEKLSNFKSLKQSSRKVIGLIEFGYFSLDHGVGKGFGGVTFTSLSELCNLHKSKLIALIRSKKSNTFRFVEIIIDNFKLF